MVEDAASEVGLVVVAADMEAAMDGRAVEAAAVEDGQVLDLRVGQALDHRDGRALVRLDGLALARLDGPVLVRLVGQAAVWDHLQDGPAVDRAVVGPMAVEDMEVAVTAAAEVANPIRSSRSSYQCLQEAAAVTVVGQAEAAVDMEVAQHGSPVVADQDGLVHQDWDHRDGQAETQDGHLPRDGQVVDRDCLRDGPAVLWVADGSLEVVAADGSQVGVRGNVLESSLQSRKK